MRKEKKTWTRAAVPCRGCFEYGAIVERAQGEIADLNSQIDSLRRYLEEQRLEMVATGEDWKLRAQAAEDVVADLISQEIGFDPLKPLREEIRRLIEKHLTELKLTHGKPYVGEEKK